MFHSTISNKEKYQEKYQLKHMCMPTQNLVFNPYILQEGLRIKFSFST